MKFELGKCYSHTTGLEMKIIGLADSTLYGFGFVGEGADGTYSMISMREDAAVNWHEIDQAIWMKNYSK